MLQLPPAPTMVPQLLDSLKSAEVETEVIVRLAVPVLERFRFCAPLLVFVFWAANVRLVGERVAVGLVIPPELPLFMLPAQVPMSPFVQPPEGAV